MLEEFANVGGTRTIVLLSASTLPELVATLSPIAPHFVLCLAAETSEFSHEELGMITRQLVKAGVSYACCWGPDAARMEESFDWTGIDRCDAPQHEDSADEVLMTTSHINESLSEAIWFAINLAWPAERYQADTWTVVIAVVGNASWTSEARDYLGRGAPTPDET